MKNRHVRFLHTANADMTAIFDWIVEASGHATVAQNFILRIYDRCEQLADFPEIGVARDDLVLGIRMLAFERRASIFYRIAEGEVQITNVLYRGRDYDSI